MPSVKCTIPRCKDKVTGEVSVASGPDSYTYAPLCAAHTDALTDPADPFDAARVALILELREEVA